jgi:hypothetical protein
MRVLQEWVSCPMCVLVWNASITRLGPMSNVDLNNWHVDFASGRSKFLMVLLIWHVNIANLGSMHNVLIMQVMISCVFH